MSEEIKISQLQEANEISANDFMMIIQSGVNKKKNIKQMAKELNPVVVSPTEPTGDNRRKVWMQEFPNLIKNLKVGDINTETGLEVEYLGFIITADYAQVESNTEYYALYNPLNSENTQCVIYEYDENKNYLGFSHVDKSRYNFTTKANTQYLKCRFMDTNLDIKCILRKNEQKIYIKNDNDVYEEFININQQIKTATYEGSFTNVSTTTNVDFSTMFPNLSLSQVICFNIEIIDVYNTWDRVYANILSTGQLQVRSYAEKQDIKVRVTAFYK